MRTLFYLIETQHTVYKSRSGLLLLTGKSGKAISNMYGEGNGNPLQYFAWKIPWMEEPGRLQSMGSLRVGHNWATSLSLSCIGEGNGNPLQCSCLENPRDVRAWWAAVYGVAQSRTWLNRLSSSSSSMEKLRVLLWQLVQKLIRQEVKNYALSSNIWGFPGGASGEESACDWRWHGFNPWVGKIS